MGIPHPTGGTASKACLSDRTDQDLMRDYARDGSEEAFAERGLAAPTAGLASSLSVQAIQSAPVGLAASVIAAAGTAGAATAATSTLGFIMASTKVKIGLAAALVAGVSAPLVIQRQTNTRLLDEVATLRQQNAELERLREANQGRAGRQIDGRDEERSRLEHAEPDERLFAPHDGGGLPNHFRAHGG